MKNKAIILDLDGTVVDSPKQKLPTRRLIKATSLLKSKYYISAATGRVWSFASPILKALKLTDPSIISAGTQICDPLTGDILWQKVIEETTLTLVIKILNKYPDYKLLHNDYVEADYFFGGVYPKDFSHLEPVYFLEQIFIPDQIADKIYRDLNRLDNITCVMVSAQKSGTKDLHITNKEATKEHAIAELLKRLKILRKNTIGVGDGSNDLHLFNAVNHKVAMGNAVIDLKKRADEVIGSVRQDSLSDYFEKLNLHS